MKKMFKMFMTCVVALAMACVSSVCALAQNQDGGQGQEDSWGSDFGDIEGFDVPDNNTSDYMQELTDWFQNATGEVIETSRQTLGSLLRGALSLIGAASAVEAEQLQKLNAQQILQHTTDKNRTDSENKAREDLLEYVTQNAQRLAGASPYYTQFMKLIDQMGYIADVTNTLRSYQSFLFDYGDESAIQNSFQVIRYYQRASNVVIEQFKSQLQLFQKQERTKEIKAVEALNFITDLTESLGSYLGNISMDCVDDMERLCYNQKVRMMTEKNRKSMSISIM